MKKYLLKLTVSLTIALSLNACFHESDSPTEALINYTGLACNSTAADSTFDGTGVINIHSEDHGLNTYEQITVRNGSQAMDYMIHNDPNASPKALLVLIAGSQLNAKIEGIVGQQATSASSNFLVRSAHLFAAQGYKVITIDRPSDWSEFVSPSGSTSGGAFDGYRTSTEHFNDLQAIINVENVNPALPVVIAGTSRGTISAVSQHNLAEYILLTAPVTSGGRGSPIGSSGVLPSALGNKPVHLIWHESDDCFVSTPSDANALVADFSNVSAVQVSGGINHPELSSRSSNKGCDGSMTYHGFPGIESCVVENATAWLDAQLQ